MSQYVSPPHREEAEATIASLGPIHGRLMVEGSIGSAESIMDVAHHLRAALDREAELQVERDAAVERAEKAEAAARAEVKRLSDPDMFWVWDDPECSLESWEDSVEQACYDSVVRLQCAKMLPDRWAATICLMVDAEGNPNETDYRLFETKDEAERCWSDSLDAARRSRNE